MIASDLASIRAGRPRVLVVRGEAGIGKSHLLRATARTPNINFFPLRGREEISAPFLPAFDVLLPAVLAPDARALLSDEAAGRLAELALAGPPAMRERDDDGARFALYRALTEGVVALSRAGPCVLVIDDLHWVDAATLGFVAHLAYQLSEARHGPIGVIAATRPLEPRSAAGRLLARLRREPICRVISLEGLGELDSAEAIRALTPAPPSAQLVRALTELTGGNPLFLKESVQALLETDLVKVAGGRLVTTVPVSALPLPREVTVGIDERLARLTPDATEVIAIAACLGDRFDPETVARLAGAPVAEARSCAEEGARLGFLDEQVPDFVFAHDLVRQAALRRISAGARARVHLEIAQSLIAADAERHEPTRIAHHLIEAGALAPQDEVARFALAAAEQAEAAGALADAAAFFEHAARAHDREQPTAAAARLFARAGRAYLDDGDVGPGIAAFEHAFARYDTLPLEALSDEDAGWRGEAAIATARKPAPAGVGWVHDTTRVDQFLAALGERLPAVRSELIAQKSRLLFDERLDEATVLAERALALARETGSKRAIADSVGTVGICRFEALDDAAALACFEEQLAFASEATLPRQQLIATNRRSAVLFAQGDLAAAWSSAEGAVELARETGYWSELALALMTQSGIAAARGEFVRCERLAEDAARWAVRSDYPTARNALVNLARARSLAGAPEKAVAALELAVREGSARRAFRQLIDVEADASGAPPAVGATNRAARDGAVPDATVSATNQRLARLAVTGELAGRTGDRDLAEVALPGLTVADERGRVLTPTWPVLVPRVRALAALALGREREAEDAFTRAAALAERIGARPEFALACLDHATLLASRDSRDETRRARALLGRAVPVLDDLRMTPALGRAVALAAALGVPVPSASDTQARTAGPLPDGLTRRELEVLQGLAAHKTNAAIARALAISPSTARRHTANIFRKIGVSTRSAAAAYCVEHELTASSR